MNRNFGGMGMGGINRQGNMMGMGQMGGPGMGILGNAPRGSGMQMGNNNLFNQQMMQQQLMRDSQLQIVSNLIQQQKQQQAAANMRMMGNQGMLGNLAGMQGMGGIPSLLNMRTKPGMGQMLGQKRGLGVSGPSDYKRMRRNRPPSPMGRRNYRNQDDRRYSRRSSRSPVRSRRDYSPDSRSRRDTERSESSPARSDHSTTDTGKEDYDPAKPTEDEDEEEIKVKEENQDEKSEKEDMGDLKVTVRDEERSVDRGGSSRRKSTEEGDEKKTNFYCHACKKECFQQQNFARHMTGVQHRRTMDKLMNVHIAKSSQLEARMKAEEHLRSIEAKGRGRNHSGSKEQRSRGQRRFRLDDEDESEEGDMVTVDTVGFEDEESNVEKKSKQVITEKDLVIPEYDANTPCGQKYVISVTGFFCKLCHKFYNNENAAKINHCQSESHYEKFHKAMTAKMNKLRDLMEQNRKAEEEKKRKQEEEKKIEEEALKEGESENREEKDMEDIEEVTLDAPGENDANEDVIEDELLHDDRENVDEDDKNSTKSDTITNLLEEDEKDPEENESEVKTQEDGNEEMDGIVKDETLGDSEPVPEILSEVPEVSNVNTKGRGGGRARVRRGRRGKH